jgi:uncharacterized protein (TIGR03086 family)
MDALQMLGRARNEFGHRLGVPSFELACATPCDDWNVRDLVQHVIAGNRMAVVMLAGNSRADVDAARRAITSRDQLGADPARAFVESADAQAAAFARPGALEATCHHYVGDIPGTQLLGFRIGDLTLHAWDLARAIGDDETLDDDLVEWVYEAMAPLASTMGKTGLFGDGPSATLRDDVALQTRLLDLAGRRP